VRQALSELVAQGPKPEDHWCRRLPGDQKVVIGRDAGAWSIPWDEWISAKHAELSWSGGRLRVQKATGARNPIFFRGKEESTFDAKPGEHFVIGMTTLTLRSADLSPSPQEPPVLRAQTFRAPDLQQIHYRDAPRRIDVLSRLPEVINSAPNDTELFHQLISLLLAGIARASAIAVVSVDPDGGDSATVEVVHWDGRAPEGPFRPSHRLIREAIQRQRGTVLHEWTPGPTAADDSYTIQRNFDWSFCTPVRGDACRGWGLYVAGRHAGDVTHSSAALEIGDDLKFTELVASIVSSLRQSQSLQHKHTLLSHFFSPAMLPILAASDPESALRPRRADVSVLFCDLRGFSRKVESAGADLVALLERVSQALGLMTQNILAQSGVIADFQGDAAMGFWGWPKDQPDGAALACLAALGIRKRFDELASQASHPLAGFRAGIGIATGPAVAGQIGTADQAKVTVFGPVVNLSSRLEGMTKLLRVPILIDEATASLVQTQLPKDVARCRRLAIVKPFGLDTPASVFELLPSALVDPTLSDEHVAHYEEALAAFLRGDWTKAYERLHLVPPQDRGKDLLLGFILQHNHAPPVNWNGVIPLESKS
jgi:adenylate cyclase